MPLELFTLGEPIADTKAPTDVPVPEMWEERKFRAKHSATLAPIPLRWQQLAFVVAPTIGEALEITHPAHWRDTDDSAPAQKARRS